MGKTPVGYLLRTETSERVLPVSGATNRLEVLCCTQTCVTLSSKPFINADILSPQIHSQIVKFVCYAQPERERERKTRPPPSVLPRTHTVFSVTSPY